MADSSHPSPGINENVLDQFTDSDGDSEFAELFGRHKQTKKTRSEGGSSKSAEPAFADTLAETGRRLSGMRKRIFGDADDLAEDPVIRKALGLSPPRKRTRRELDFSTPAETAVDMPCMPTSSYRPPNQGRVDSQYIQSGNAATGSLSAKPPALEAASPSVPGAEHFSVERFSEWLEDNSPASKSGENMGLLLETSSVARTSEQSQMIAAGAPVYTPRVQLAELSTGSSRQMEFPSHQHESTQLASTTIQVSPQPPQVRQHPTPQRRQHGPYELIAFPPYNQALPAGLTLHQICQDYPNHLKNETMRRFVNAEWSGKKIWDSMRGSAKVSASSTRPWNKLEHRLLKEKKRMAEEQAAQGEQEEDADSSKEIVQSSDDEPSGTTTMPEVPHPYFSNMQSDVVGAEPMSPALGAPSPVRATHRGRVREQCTTPTVQVRLGTIRQSFKAELEEQKCVLSMMLSYDDQDWVSKSQQEKGRRVREEWIRRAKRLERTFAADHNIDADGLGIEQTSESDMLRRLKILVTMSKARPIAAESTDDGNRLVTYQEQLDVLKDWTAQWRQQLQERARHAIK